MAPVLRATPSTSPTGTNRNSASRSTNVRMSQGQATRLTFTLARVTHFIAASGGLNQGRRACPSPSDVFNPRIFDRSAFLRTGLLGLVVDIAQRLGHQLKSFIIMWQAL